MITLSINGTPIQASEGMTVLEAARQEGIEIPTLCYLKALGPFGVCRLCIVEANGPGLIPAILPSCNLKVFEGLVITTDSAVLHEIRRTMIELLLASTPLSESLRGFAIKFGVEASRFTPDKKDPCILCGLCVRVCRDRIGASALSFAGSDSNRHVVAEEIRIDKEACIGCGTCANICPVQAIKLEDMESDRKIVLYGKVASRFELVKCDICGNPHTTQEFIDSVVSRLNEEQKKGVRNLCPECARHYYAEAMTGHFTADVRGNR
jgi:NADH dehydrogenase/NADH:ubiquinone oxidoreductase subunit G